MSDLSEVRASIDALDSKIAALMAERLRLKARQRQQLMGEPPLMKQIRDAVRRGGADLGLEMVACCGAEGAYAQQAACQMFEVPTILYFNCFEKVFEAVESGICPYGVLPVENSTAGSVAAVYDLMQKHRFHVVRALKLKILHVLLANRGAKLEEITEVASHPQALSQCNLFLKAHPKMQMIPSANTAMAARELAGSGRTDRAVIASRACADLYGLTELQETVSDTTDNYTRFICIARDLAISPRANKLSVMLRLPHRPGSLCEIVSKFASIGINLTKLESRPVPGSPFEFRFVFDFDASATSPDVQALLAELSTEPEIDHFTLLGAYEES